MVTISERLPYNVVGDLQARQKGRVTGEESVDLFGITTDKGLTEQHVSSGLIPVPE